MCGITGIFASLDRRPIDRELLTAMNDTQRHRGPDGDGLHLEPGVGLGHRRLAIIDIATGQQPLYNEDETVVVVYNGEIYNFADLTTELRNAGHKFRTHSDTEVVVHAWEEWGPRCVERFAGMFAFALWDRGRQTLFLARDRLGKKPLYYAMLADGQLLFGSELKSLLRHPGLKRRLATRAVEDYLTFGYVPDPDTILEGVRKLPPGHTLECVRGRALPAPKSYWDLRFAADVVAPEPAVCEELIQRLRFATERRLISEVPLGAFLSGGVDSSAVVAQMAAVSAQPVNTCSIAFDDPAYDESRYATLVAQRYGCNHAVERVSVDDYELIDSLVDIYDEPFADSSAIPTYRVCQLARKRVTVALSGDAGDENFAGYRRYRWHLYEEQLRSRLPLALRRALFGPLGRLYPKLDWAPRVFRAKTTFQSLALDTLEAYLQSVSFIGRGMRALLYNSSFKRELDGYDAIEVFRALAANAPHDDALSLVQYLDFKTYLPGDILVKVDRASMAHSLEVRVPMLDHEFVEWVARLPSGLKLHGGEGKYILKKALAADLPREIMDRPKMGFAVPIGRWFRGALREEVRTRLLSGALGGLNIFDAAAIETLIDEHQGGRRDHSAPLWSLLMFEGFARRVLAA
ncbi:MAG TPA: XrtA/PEP-CTERM system amidotransferase [Steroidobacteraceae bacterium]|nr:XrtA/PEP-CTERM system amidotransferase [Steroidobacteraceae bacterium]